MKNSRVNTACRINQINKIVLPDQQKQIRKCEFLLSDLQKKKHKYIPRRYVFIRSNNRKLTYLYIRHATFR